MVTLGGLIKNGVWGKLAMLPPDYRPPKRIIFGVNNHAKTSRVDVFPTGEVRWVAGSKDYGWVSLAGISFQTNDPAP